MKQVSKRVLALAVGLASATFAHAQAQDPHHGHGSAQVTKVSAEVSVEMASGEVKKIDKSAGKITLKHGPLPRLEMPGMTMVFRVSDPKMLDQVKVGDKVKFDADKVNGALTVVKMEAAK